MPQLSALSSIDPSCTATPSVTCKGGQLVHPLEAHRSEVRVGELLVHKIEVFLCVLAGPLLLLLVLVRAFFISMPAVQASVVCIILAVSLATQLARLPYTHSLENKIENFTLLDHAMVVLLGIIFLSLRGATGGHDTSQTANPPTWASLTRQPATKTPHGVRWATLWFSIAR